MKDSVFDVTVDKLHDLRKIVRQKLHEDYTRTRPFRREVIPPQELMAAYEEIALSDMQGYIQKYGLETVNAFIAEMEQRKGKEIKRAIRNRAKP